MSGSEKPPQTPREESGVWVAFNYDGSAFVPFATELEALRYASNYQMPVTFVHYGDDAWMRGTR